MMATRDEVDLTIGRNHSSGPTIDSQTLKVPLDLGYSSRIDPVCVCPAFHIDSVFDNWWQFILVMFLTTSISNVGSSIPAAPGGIGL